MAGGCGYFCADSTCVPAKANIFSPAAPLSATFSNSFRAALELVVRKSSSTGVSYKHTHIQRDEQESGNGRRGK